MRTTKVVAFSVPPDFEREIQKHAEAEHRTVSEYVREAIRQYMNLRDFDATQKKVSKRLKKKGLKASDVESAVAELRKRA
jgi:predicted DNA-binding protein